MSILASIGGQTWIPYPMVDVLNAYYVQFQNETEGLSINLQSLISLNRFEIFWSTRVPRKNK